MIVYCSNCFFIFSPFEKDFLVWSQRICPKARYSLKDPRAFAQFLRDSDVRLVRAKFGPQSLQLCCTDLDVKGLDH